MGVSIGRLFSTDIRATGGFFLLLGLYFYLWGIDQPARGAVVCMIIVVSLLVHEFGHVFAVRRELGSESVVILWGLGGLCVHEPARTPKQRIVIALGGPLFTAILALLGGLTFLAVRNGVLPAPHPLVGLAVGALLVINLIWLIFNLLPIMPLDGGQALEAILERRMGRPKAQAALRRVSTVAACLVIGFALYIREPFIAVIAILLLMRNISGNA
ncbi:MAG: site-2 protease family protein [Planctomycetota bacterium]